MAAAKRHVNIKGYARTRRDRIDPALDHLDPVEIGALGILERGNQEHGRAAAIDQITDVIQNRVMNSEDRKEGGRAFVEKRSAVWPAASQG